MSLFCFSDLSGSLGGARIVSGYNITCFTPSLGKCSICAGCQVTVPRHLWLVWEQCSCDLRFDVQKENIEYGIRHLQASGERA